MIIMYVFTGNIEPSTIQRKKQAIHKILKCFIWKTLLLTVSIVPEVQNLHFYRNVVRNMLSIFQPIIVMQ